MREIKFRGLSEKEDYLESDEWVYGGIGTCASGEFIIIRDGESIIVYKETIGEYTGIKDKNGVEIYEGDIVACYSLTHPNEKYIGEIVFMSEEFKIIWYDGEILRLNKIRFWANSRNIEVIGNIFENTKLKELLEGEDE